MVFPTLLPRFRSSTHVCLDSGGDAINPNNTMYRMLFLKDSLFYCINGIGSGLFISDFLMSCFKRHMIFGRSLALFNPIHHWRLFFEVHWLLDLLIG